MKSELEGELIKYAIAVRSKIYYFDIPEKINQTKKIKKITYAVKITVITNELYIDSILGQTLSIQN